MLSANGTLAQRVAPLFGAGYVFIGVLGFFFTGFGSFVQDTPDAILGFSINPFHNLVHFTIGAYLLLMSRQRPDVAEGAIVGVGLFYVVATVIGVASPHSLSIISMSGRGDLENLNHIVNGTALTTIGVLSWIQSQSSARRAGAAA
ncbi:MAG: DUF4383 domain-containing protein [Actinomycetota bacterium]|nr:DUF4383 domain-containing protein [Actinomycetota bacterium]